MDQRFKLAFLLLVSLFLFSCSEKVTNVRQGGDIVIYPPPPDTTRIQYLASISTAVDITGKKSGFSRFLFGESENQQIIKPYGLATHNNILFACDAGINGLVIMDLREKTFSQFIPRGRGQLKTPTNCWVDSLGTLYVADPGRRQIVVFDTLGQYVDAFGDSPKSKPTDVTVYNERIWVPDAAQNRVSVYGKSDRKLIFSFPDSTITDEGHLFQPVNICVANDIVYVTDFGDFKVKSYSLSGEFISAVGGFGNAFGQLARPKGISVDKEGNLFVVDAAFENVQLFNKKGQLLMFFGGTYKGAGGMYLPAKVMVDYENLAYYQQFVDPAFKLKYLIFVTNQYGPDKISVYGAVDAKK